MKYAYQLIYGAGIKALNIQSFRFTEAEMLKACKESDDAEFNSVKQVKYLGAVPKGYHICGCGNIVKGTKGELCDECRAIYGHRYEHEL